MTTNTGLNQPAYNSTSPTWDQPLNYNETILDSILGNTTSVAMPTGSSTTTTLSGPASSGSLGQTQAMRIVLTGSLSANQTLQFPSGIGGRWIVYNNTSGAYSILLTSGGGGSSVTAPQGYNVSIYSDGTNIKYTDDGLTNNFPTLTVLGNTYLATTTGNVGIGTNSPVTKFQVGSGGSTSWAWFNQNVGGSTPSSSITTGLALGGNYSGGGTEGNIIYGTYLTFAKWNGSTYTENMRIDSSGNVGIGTSSPQRKLDIEQVSTDYQLRIGDTGGHYYDIGRNTTTGFLTFYGSQSNANGFTFTGVDGERMRIDSNGNVCIGTSTASSLLTVNGTVTASSFSGSGSGLTGTASSLNIGGNAATATTATTATTANNVSGTVAVANGGTGTTSLAANNVILGNGTSAVQTVAPGTSGNVLTSNGTTWSSQTPSGLGINQSWYNVSGSRSLGTTYTNSSGNPIQVLAAINVSGGSSTAFVNVGGISVQEIGSSNEQFVASISFIVPNGITYSISGSSASIQSWAELR